MSQFFDNHSIYAPFLLRIFLAFHLIKGVLDNILSWERMIEFAEFLKIHHFPIPLVSAVLSVSIQFICAILILIGFKTRIAAFLLVINFIIALVMVHLGDTYQNSFPAIVMLVASLFLLLNGSGKPSIDKNH